MSDKPLTYKDAMKLLSSQDSKIVGAIDKLFGGVILAAGIFAGPGALTFLGPKNELVKLSNEAVTKLSGRAKRAIGIERANLVVAAHTVLTVTAYFAALKHLLAELYPKPEITKDEQLHVLGVAARTGSSQLAGGEVGASSQIQFVRRLVMSKIPAPSSDISLQESLKLLQEYYEAATGDLIEFLRGLAHWERLSETKRNSLENSLLSQLPPLAVEQYKGDFLRLAADAPEFLVWATLQEHAATQSTFRSGLERMSETLLEEAAGLHQGLADLRYVLEQVLQNPSIGAQTVYETLMQVYERGLNEAIIDSEATTISEIGIPSLVEGYINPHYKLATIGRDSASPSQESWWREKSTRTDISELLAFELLSGDSVDQPILVLGHPGSGKSLLTKVLAGQLPRGATGDSMDRTRFKKPLVLTALVALGLGAIEIDALLEEHDALGDHPQRSSFAAAVLHRQHEPHNHPEATSSGSRPLHRSSSLGPAFPATTLNSWLGQREQCLP